MPETIRIEEHGGGGGGFVLLCTAGDRYEAEIIRGVLDVAGVAPVIVEPIQVIGAWMFPSGHERLPQRILVLKVALESARLALMEARLDAGEGEEAETAPSPRPVAARVRALRMFALAAFAIALVATVLSRIVRYGGGLP